MTKMHKGPLINCVEKPFGRLKSNIELCRSAAGKIDRLQADCIKSKTELKALQQNKLDNVQNRGGGGGGGGGGQLKKSQYPP